MVMGLMDSVTSRSQFFLDNLKKDNKSQKETVGDWRILTV